MALKHRKQALNVAQLPLFVPDSDWKPLPYEKWPDLSSSELIAFDIETDDPHLHEAGPGFIRGDATVCGIAFATLEHGAFYLPFGHAADNLDRDKVIAYAKEQLGRHHQEKVGANISYDLEGLWSLGISVAGKLNDCQVAEPLLDADREDGYSLDVLSKSYLGYGKDERLLKEAEVTYGVEHKRGMKHLPARFIGEYAAVDADNTLQVFLLQKEEMRAEDVTDIYDLETELLPVLQKMRLNGVRVDLDKAEQLVKTIKKEEELLYSQLREMAGGRHFNTSAPAELEPILKSRGIIVPRTAKTGGPSITNEWVLRQDDPFCKGLVNLRKTIKMRSDFIEGSILKYNVKGRLHTKWVQLRSYDDEGGRSIGVKPGRIASVKPNLAQIPARDPKWGPLIRSMFVADKDGFWTKCDYGSQEPRALLHFAYLLKLEGAAEIREQYIKDPDTDYHLVTNNLIIEKSGKDIGRKASKIINLAAAYTAGNAKIAQQLGMSIEVATEILEAYHKGVPYTRQLVKACTARVNDKGYLRTILGRKQRFPYWEPADFNRKWGTKPVKSYAEAVRLWGPNVSRANAHVAINPLVQGSCADQMKKALILLDKEGLTAQVTVYDECNTTLYDMKQVRRMQEILETAVPQFTIPFSAHPDIGPSWGELTALKWDGGKYV